MMSKYYNEEDLIKVLSIHIPLLAYDAIYNSLDWRSIIDDGEIYNGVIEGVSNPYIYDVPIEGGLTSFVHPMICTEIYYDPFVSKDVYMGRKEGEIW